MCEIKAKWRNGLHNETIGANVIWYREFSSSWNIDDRYYKSAIRCGICTTGKSVMAVKFREFRLATRALLPMGNEENLSLHESALDTVPVDYPNQAGYALEHILADTEGLPAQIVALLCEFRLQCVASKTATFSAAVFILKNRGE